ncbi:3-oxoacyl-ACP reductase FabG [bacterium]|nr:3-oxoacyl-ACP reductase FabG [bacterium]
MKYALVTGGSRGIGRAICLKLATMGYHILVNYRSNKTAAEETLSLIRDAGGDGELLPFDVANRKEVEETLEGWVSAHENATIEVLVNNAGIRKDTLLMWMKDEEWDSVLDTHLGGFFIVTRTLLKGMLTQKYGRIVNVVSLSGIKGLPGQTNYSAAKAGVIGATKALAQEVARRKITVNAVAPGFISTDMTSDLNEKELKGIIPMKRFGTAEEVAEAVGFLASPGASYITGVVLSINGGLYT